MTPQECFHLAADQPRMVRNRHERDCNLSGCPGCLPCEARHCVMPPLSEKGEIPPCGGAHLDTFEALICAQCLGRIRANMASLAGYFAGFNHDLLTEAAHRGVNSEAMMLASPVADPEALGHRRRSAMGGRSCQCPNRAHYDHAEGCPAMAWLLNDLAVGELHPLTVLGGWEMMAREELDLPSDEELTVPIAVKFLDEHLTTLARMPDWDIGVMAREIHKCRAHVDAVLHNEPGDRQRGATCTVCPTGRRIEKHTGEKLDKHGNIQRDETGMAITADVWICPGCGAEWTDAEYRFYVEGEFTKAAEWLSSAALSTRLRVQQKTINTWYRRGQIRRKRNGLGQLVYSVRDGERMRETGA